MVSKAASVAKTAAVAGGGGVALIGAAVDNLQTVAPAVPILRDIASLPWWLLAAGGVAAVVAVIVWLVLRRK
ncbi:hypothetical protein [Inquilinus sp.]|uniref:hypothetical protein n=1 Tax=Inquilinus sp. TaxID=1932117 RepID=UPI0031DC977E